MKNSPKVKFIENSDEMMGIDIDGKEVILSLPKTFRVVDDYEENNENYILFLKTLSLGNVNNSSYKTSDSNDGTNLPIVAYLWIIEDYLRNGYYFERERRFEVNSGKINWRRTIRKTPIYFNGDFIYDHLVTTRLKLTDGLITEIYKVCLLKSLQIVGWAFSNINTYVEIRTRLTRAEMIKIVQNELNSTFDDIKRKRFSNMLKILNDGDDAEVISKKCKFKVNNYYYIYEQMVDIFFRGSKDTSQYNPKGSWLLLNNNTYRKENATSLRPDTILVKDDITYILDAKMYKYGFTRNKKDLPNSQSIQKQITYGDYISNHLKKKKIRNSFILPYNKERDKSDDYNYLDDDKNIAYIGYAIGEWRNTKKKTDYDRIYTFLIDFNYLLNNYNKNENDEIICLCNKIEKLIKEIK